MYNSSSVTMNEVVWQLTQGADLVALSAAQFLCVVGREREQESRVVARPTINQSASLRLLLVGVWLNWSIISIRALILLQYARPVCCCYCAGCPCSSSSSHLHERVLQQQELLRLSNWESLCRGICWLTLSRQPNVNRDRKWTHLMRIWWRFVTII